MGIAISLLLGYLTATAVNGEAYETSSYRPMSVPTEAPQPRDQLEDWLAGQTHDLGDFWRVKRDSYLAKKLAEQKRLELLAQRREARKLELARKRDESNRELTVLTWNLCAEFCPDFGRWAGARSTKVADEIKASGADVILLQETGQQSRHLPPLMEALGESWAIASYRKSKLILFNRKTVDNTTKDGKSLPAIHAKLTAKGDTRWAAYAQLRLKKADLIFTVGDYHLRVGKTKGPIRDSQFRQASDRLEEFTRGTPIFGGDFNSYGPIKADSHRSGVHREALRRGYSNSLSLALKAEGANRATYLSTRDSAPGTIGRHIDHIYVPQTTEVLRWTMGPQTGLTDHAWVRATLRLPR